MVTRGWLAGSVSDREGHSCVGTRSGCCKGSALCESVRLSVLSRILLNGEMLAQVSRYPLRVPVRIMPGSRRQQAVHQDRFIQQGAALLAGLGLCISSFSLKKLSAMPHKPRRLI
ncbi:uncharacterized protein LOC122256251 isoform X1 [Penaeus japonicus]|uniref:uncharacterized protein LOC122256251 isoform X1 n=1 Tax=Penaeus japonicus TaxID=27405 RepID=UPI001C70F0AA|nr:uncharacterized protein LOC122256251 isoform X1 [Penaeus japonicus]